LNHPSGKHLQNNLWNRSSLTLLHHRIQYTITHCIQYTFKPMNCNIICSSLTPRFNQRMKSRDLIYNEAHSRPRRYSNTHLHRFRVIRYDKTSVVRGAKLSLKVVERSLDYYRRHLTAGRRKILSRFPKLSEIRKCAIIDAHARRISNLTTESKGGHFSLLLVLVRDYSLV